VETADNVRTNHKKMLEEERQRVHMDQQEVDFSGIIEGQKLSSFLIALLIGSSDRGSSPSSMALT